MKIFGFEFGRKKDKVDIITLPMDNTYNHEKFYSVSRQGVGVSRNGSGLNYDYNIPAVTELLNSNYIYFGEDNQYPNILNNLYYSSPFHASIVDFKRLNLIGGGYEVTPMFGATEADLIMIKQMEYMFDENTINKLTTDLLIHNRICIRVTWNTEHTKIIRLERVEPANVRSTKKVDGKVKKYAYNIDWTAALNARQNDYIYIPAFDSFDKSEKEQLYVWQGFSPGLEYYTQPTYANAANWMALDGQISYYHKSNMENSINPSVVLKFPEKLANKEEEQQFIQNLRRSFTGAKNAGKVLTFFSNGRDLLPEIDVLPGNQLGDDFQVTNETIIKNIAFSHTINPIIMGIAVPGNLGAGAELDIAYRIFQNTFVKPNQKTLNDVINFFYKINAVKATFTLNETNILI
jgi:hypothetical protein